MTEKQRLGDHCRLARASAPKNAIASAVFVCLCSASVLANSPQSTPSLGVVSQGASETRVDADGDAGRLHQAQEWLNFAVALATLAGIPTAIYLYLQDRKKERRTRTLEAYLEASNRYNDFLNRVFDHPELNCGEFRSTDRELKDSGMDVRQLTLFTQLILTLERAWFVYKIYDVASQTSRDDLHGVWNTWLTAFDFWAQRPDFQAAWKCIDPNTPSSFSEYMANRFAHFAQLNAEQSHAMEPATGSVSNGESSPPI